jgi:hypothetical protein
MTDYYASIADAVTGLDNKTGEIRNAVYDRARAAQMTQFLVSKITEAEKERERLALEQAIRQVELDATNKINMEVRAPRDQAFLKPRVKLEPDKEQLNDESEQQPQRLPIESPHPATHADGIKKPTRGQTALRFAGGMLLLSIIVLVVSFGATLAYIRGAAWISARGVEFPGWLSRFLIYM